MSEEESKYAIAFRKWLNGGLAALDPDEKKLLLEESKSSGEFEFLIAVRRGSPAEKTLTRICEEVGYRHLLYWDDDDE